MSLLGTLRAAAEQVALEESQSGLNCMLHAADHVANEHGFESPLKDRNRSRNPSTELDANALLDSMRSFNLDDKKNLKTFSQSIDRRDQNSDDENIKVVLPSDRKNKTEDLTDDVAALLQLERVETPERSKTNSPKIEKKKELEKKSVKIDTKSMALSREQQWYMNQLTKLNKNKTSRPSSRRSSSSRGSIPGYESEISKRLSISTNKSYGESIKSSFSSSTQELLCRNMLVLQLEENRKKKINEKELRSRINSLSKPAKKEFDEIDYKLDPTLRYSTLSDAKELTFKPKIGNGKAKKSRADDDDGNDSKSDDVILRFVRRQEDREKSKRDELDSQIAERDYKMRHDRKICLKCNIIQSYDEYIERRNICQNCNIEYRHMTLSLIKAINQYGRDTIVRQIINKKENEKRKLKLQNEAKDDENDIKKEKNNDEKSESKQERDNNISNINDNSEAKETDSNNNNYSEAK